MQKAAVDKEWDKLETSMEFGKSQEQKGSYLGSTQRQEESPLCHIDGHVSLQECGVGTPIPEIQRQSRAPRWHSERRLWSPR